MKPWCYFSKASLPKRAIALRMEFLNIYKLENVENRTQDRRTINSRAFAERWNKEQFASHCAIQNTTIYLNVTLRRKNFIKTCYAF